MTAPQSARQNYVPTYERPVQRLVRNDDYKLIWFWGLHIVLALLATLAPGPVSTAHALLTVLIGVMIAGSRAPLIHVAYVSSYIVGAELFWRMAGANIFWETGKYALI